jgi:hypothetical protein
VNLTLKVLKENFAVCRLENTENIPEWAIKSNWYSISKTEDELSIVCNENDVPNGVKVEKNWRSFKVEGVLDFGLVGILASLSSLMAKNSISIFAISTYDTDYILMKNDKVSKAIEIFKENGYKVIEE